ncbi:hypothetical protein GLW05_21455 [Pontibacillus yanchengensis]|uniref:Spore coat protein n=2 Tax=Pontibacillus yanchengensis TaxID=462910 RepID=A0A6I5A7D8_9BACI|nr:hypothetical protein [Pontibacillus yanchengensis]
MWRWKPMHPMHQRNAQPYHGKRPMPGPGPMPFTQQYPQDQPFMPMSMGEYPQQQPFQPYPNQPAQEEQPRPPVFQTPYEQFAKPPQPNQWNPYYSLQQQYPQQNQQATPKGIMNYFQDKNGQLDLDKMLSTMGQVANTANQFSPLVKGLGSFMKGL